jgi:acyl transferase domain-containing protein
MDRKAKPANGHIISPTTESTLEEFEPIAICGIGLRLPGGIKDPQAFYDFLYSKKDARIPIPTNRFNIDGFYNPSPKVGSLGFKHGYFLDCDLEKFDAGFFTATKAEAELIDPQQRLLMEVVYEAFQNAGESNWRGKKIGCYAGVYGEDWHDLHSIDTQETGMYRTTGHGDFVLGNRVSYEYDLQGPR